MVSGTFQLTDNGAEFQASLEIRGVVAQKLLGHAGQLLRFLGW
jgi:hypothetical protein